MQTNVKRRIEPAWIIALQCEAFACGKHEALVFTSKDMIFYISRFANNVSKTYPAFFEKGWGKELVCECKPT